jgi:hypothetical protein
LGANYTDVFYVSTYSLSRTVEARGREIGAESFQPGPTAGGSFLFEGLPSLDASMGVEVIARGR